MTRSVLLPSLVVACCSAVFWLPAPAAAAAPARAGTDLKSDSRLQVAVSMKANTCSAYGMASLITEATGVTVLVVPRLSRRSVTLAADARPAREWMESFALLLDGVWVQVGDRYVLGTSPALPPLAELTVTERAWLKLRTYRQLLDSLTPGQKATLLSTGELPLDSHLTAEQRPLVQTLWHGTTVVERPEASPEGQRPGRLFLRITRPDRDEVGLWVQFPSGGSRETGYGPLNPPK